MPSCASFDSTGRPLGAADPEAVASWPLGSGELGFPAASLGAEGGQPGCLTSEARCKSVARAVALNETLGKGVKVIVARRMVGGAFS
jgi:hypothetical protein